MSALSIIKSEDSLSQSEGPLPPFSSNYVGGRLNLPVRACVEGGCQVDLIVGLRSLSTINIYKKNLKGKNPAHKSM